MSENAYLPFPSKILKVVMHTEKEYTFVMEYHGDVKPGQFFEVSVPIIWRSAYFCEWHRKKFRRSYYPPRRPCHK